MLTHPAPMTPLTTLQLTIWRLAFLMLVTIAVGMYRRNLIRESPFFFGYIIFRIVQSFAEMIAYNTSYTAYFYVYWTTEVIDDFVTFLVIQEIFNIVFRPYESLRRVGVVLFRCTLLVLVIVAVATALGASANPGITARVHALTTLQRSTLFAEAGLIVCLMLFSRLFGLTWRNYVFGISLGFGVTGCVSGIAAMLVVHVPQPYFDWCRVLIGYGSTMTEIVWLYYIVLRSRSLQVDESQIDASLLKGWNRALEGVLNE